MAQGLRSDLPDVSVLHRLISATRRLLRAAWTLTGLGITLGLGLALLLTVSLGDLAVPLQPWFRLVGLLLVVVPSGVAFFNGVIRPLFRRMTARFVARRIESQLPGIHNRLVSCVDLDAQKQQKFSLAFLQRLIREAIERVKDFRPWSVVDQRALRRAGLFALTGTIVFGTALGIFSDRLPTALARIFSPFADIPPATGVLFDVQPGTCKVLRGEAVDFQATVTKGKVERLRLEITPIEGDDVGKTLWHDLRLSDDGRWTFRLPAFDHSFQYRVHGGGTWTKLATVTMLERPRLVGLQAAVHYPSYMLMPEPRVNPPDVADVTGPIDSTVEVKVRVEGDPSVGEIQLLREDVHHAPVTNRPQRVWFDGVLPKGHAVEGNWEWQPESAGQPPASEKPKAEEETDQPAKRWHSHPAVPGMSYHLFHSAAVPFEVHLNDVLFAEVFVPSDQAPEELMIAFHDGQNWERRAFWGADKISVGQSDTISRRHAGDLPKSGEWLHLEVPACDLDLEGRSIRGVSFSQFGGKCLWGRVGTLPPATHEVREFIVTETFPLQKVEAVNAVRDANELSESKGLEAPDRKTFKGQATHSRHFASIRPAETWSGTFSLRADGWYRVELKNEIGAANLPMQEARITAVLDAPPQIMIERPGVDLVLSEPIKVPVVIAAFDDFGLGELVLSVQRPGASAFQGRPVKTYSSVLRADTTIVMLDLAQESLKAGDVLKYRAEIRDRKGQTAQTQDYSIRIAPNDPNAADKKLAQLEQQEAAAREKLDKLIDEQQKIQDKLEKLEEQHQSLTEKLEAAQDAADQSAEATTPEQAKEQAAKQKEPGNKESGNKDQPKDKEPAKPEATKPEASPPEAKKSAESNKAEMALDAEAQKELTAVKQELAQLQQQEQQNAAAAQQLGEQLKAMANDAAQQQLVPPELQREMQQLSETFQNAAVKPLKDMANELQQAAQPKTQNPKLPQLAAQGEQTLQNLETLRDRLEAVQDTTKEIRNDAQQALEELRREMTQKSGELSARELEALREAIEALRAKLQNLAENETQLMEFTPTAPEMLLNDLEKQQTGLERKAAKELAKTKELQRSEPYQKLRRPAPMSANDTSESQMTERMSEEGVTESPATNEPDAAAFDQPTPDASQQPEFKPALSEPAAKSKSKANGKKSESQKPTTKANSKAEPSAKAPSNGQERREQLADRQSEQLEQLQMAEESLAADQRALDELLAKLEEALNPDASEAMPSSDDPMGTPAQAKTPGKDAPMPSDGQPQASEAGESTPVNAEQAAELAELMQSETFQKALQMAARARAMSAGKSLPQASQNRNQTPANEPPQKSNPQPEGAREAGFGNQFAMEAVLRELDPATRSAILKMQPRIREELLQGLRDEGPEGYQRFIRDYFERLTKAGQGTRK